MKHAPGPWTLEHDWQEQPGGILILSADNQIVADAWATHAERQANAHLIAAAPVMYESLKWAMKHVENVFALAGPSDQELPELAKARAAIARAEGRT